MGLGTGLAIGCLTQRWFDERECLTRLTGLYSKVQKAQDRCNEANEGIAKAIIDYKGGPLD
jgi:hypothetical protein